MNKHLLGFKNVSNKCQPLDPESMKGMKTSHTDRTKDNHNQPQNKVMV